VQASPKPLPAALAANACWFPSTGSDANNDAAAMTKMATNNGQDS